MRVNGSALAGFLPLAAFLSGSTGSAQAKLPTASSTPAVVARSMKGKAFGGQQPVSGATIALYTYGNSGYGSAGTLLATSVTDDAGNFTIDPSSINCPTASTPVYILSIAGNPQIGRKNENNTAIMLGAGLGTCGNAVNAYVVINEVSTAALAYSLSHFFSSATNDGTTADHFGSPSAAVNAVTVANSGTIPTLITVANGYPNSSSPTVTLESAKLYTLANILGHCVNSVGAGSGPCTNLFADATPTGGVAPVNILEAAVNIALNPTLKVNALYNLQPTDGTQAFDGGLTAAPNDWTLAVSYTAPSFGLGINTHSVSTIDLDPAGHIWFPSNLPGATGVAYFDPYSSTFTSLFTGSRMVRPEQIAIDSDDVVWASDIESDFLNGFPIARPDSPVPLSLPGYTSTALTVFYDGNLRVGVLNTAVARPSLAAVTGETSYKTLANTRVPNSRDLEIASLGADVQGGFAVAATDVATPSLDNLYYNGSYTHVVNGNTEDAGQAIFTGTDYISVRGGYTATEDGLCIYSAQACYSMNNRAAVRHPSGLAIDGAGSLWLADQNTASVEQVPSTNGSYLNANNHVLNRVYIHDGNNGGTLVNPTGIAIDGTGNVWVSNFGCNTTGCTPTSFVLSELVGAGTPTITPISAQVVGTYNLVGTEPGEPPSPAAQAASAPHKTKLK